MQKKLLILLVVIAVGLIPQKTIPPQLQRLFTTPTPTVRPPTTNLSQTAVVTRVIDGDTIEIESGQKVRYIGIDTPETKHPTKALQCFGQEAYLQNKQLVEGKRVRLVKDVSEVDRYGRLLRYVYVNTESSPSGLFVNDFLVREGFAHARTYPPDVRHTDLFLKSEQQARMNNHGLWSTCTQTPIN